MAIIDFIDDSYDKARVIIEAKNADIITVDEARDLLFGPRF